jgi:hypothetical protein
MFDGVSLSKNYSGIKMNNYSSYDFVIVGGGPAGIYASHRINEVRKSSILILERKPYVGGRTRMFKFNDHLVNSGAYAMRDMRDNKGIELLKYVGMPTTAHDVSFDYSYVDKVDIAETFKDLTKAVTSVNQHLNTKAFVNSVLGPEEYNRLVTASGRTDFELECITDTLTHYDIADNISGHDMIPVNWNDLWEKLSESMNIEYGIDVTDINRVDDGFIIKSYDQYFIARNVIIATDILTIRRLLPMYPIYRYIEAQPFVRIYGVFDEKGQSIMSKYIKMPTPVASSLQNISPVTKDLYIIALADNSSAQALAPYIQDNEENRNILEDMLINTLVCPGLKGTLKSICGYYNNPGTHYYPYYDGSGIPDDDILTKSIINRAQFIHQAQRPGSNIWVVGEVISMSQGWVEGALESVEAIMPDIINIM